MYYTILRCRYCRIRNKNKFWRVLFVPWQWVVILLSLGCTLSCAGWGRLVAIVACRSGLYLRSSLSESYKHSKWLFRRTSWCLMVSSHPRLIVWELICLKWLFNSAIVVTGKSWQAHGDTQCSVVLGISVHFKVHKSNPTSPRCVLGTQRIFPWVANGALAFSCCLVVGLFR